MKWLLLLVLLVLTIASVLSLDSNPSRSDFHFPNSNTANRFSR